MENCAAITPCSYFAQDFPYSKDWLINNPKNFYIKFSEWYGRLFDDPAFVAKVKERFAVYYAHRQDIIDHIDATCCLTRCRSTTTSGVASAARRHQRNA